MQVKTNVKSGAGSLRDTFGWQGSGHPLESGCVGAGECVAAPNDIEQILEREQEKDHAS